ncbi:outer membrane porin, OprD family [Pseudomonas sp. P115]|uniref:OprD family outer membrane porin n=1 Tax=Pseudomonas pisciculturae TaxID=2730413 RepID=UPI0018926DCE|nr:OprD family outer membrane porin [Pseudomonas pisciculturae]MBF6029790.1 outer membrane porin, OprD family [Pseudomonas pisciculturae]
MQIVRSTQVAVGFSAVFFLAPMTLQAQEAGFIEDSSLTLDTRQWYSHEIARKDNYYTAHTSDGVRKVHDRTAWSLSAKLDYVSGFTQGMVGFGLDLSLYSVVALERSKLATAGGGNRLLVNADGGVVDDWSKLGIAALKFKVADTVAKVGRHQVRTPVMGFSDTRMPPSSYNGASLESHDIEGLTIKSGYFDRGTPRTAAGSEALHPTYGSRLVTSDWIAYGGADYLSKSGWRASAYTSRFKDIWDRQYLGAGRQFNWFDIATDVQVDFYNTQSSGSEVAGKIAQQAYGLTFTPKYKNHTLKLSYQQINGDEYFDLVSESNAFTLPNSQLSNYNGPNERSFQINYINDFAAYGVPGFKTNLWYIKGWGIDGTHYDGGTNGIYTSVLKQDNESHHEIAAFASYVLQSGQLKGANVFGGYVWHRGSGHQLEGNVEEFRLVFNVPIKIF